MLEWREREKNSVHSALYPKVETGGDGKEMRNCALLILPSAGKCENGADRGRGGIPLPLPPAFFGSRGGLRVDRGACMADEQGFVAHWRMVWSMRIYYITYQWYGLLVIRYI